MQKASQFQRLGLFVFLLGLYGFFGILAPHFLTPVNITNILVQSAVPIIVATGMTLVIATAGIDLSIGSIFSLSGIMGVPIHRILIYVYAISGITTSMSGIIVTSCQNKAEAIPGMGMELKA